MPNPWVALSHRPDVLMVRDGIPEPGRYYDSRRTIVMRTGLLVAEERRHLFHEIVHADRRDLACYSSDMIEVYVERQAAKWAMPTEVLERAMPQVLDWSELAEVLKLPEDWVRFRWSIASRREKMHLRGVNRREAHDL